MTRKQSETMTSEQITEENVKSVQEGSNSIEVALVEEAAHQCVIAWFDADEKQGSADATAVHVIVRAVALDMFPSDCDPARSHRIGTNKVRSQYANDVLTSLFGIEKPSAADRARLNRIKLVVPAILKAGGLSIIDLSETGNLLLDTSCEYFKICMKSIEASVGTKLKVSIASLDRGARKYLKEEIAVTKREPLTAKEKKAQKDADAIKLPSMKLVQLAKSLEERIPETKDKLTASETKQLQLVLVQLLGLFAVDQTGLDTDKVTKIYSKVS